MRLIDADKLPKYTGYALSADEVAMAVENAPTIDAVPVVRCKDCIHRVYTDEGESCPDDIVCDLWESDGFYETDYCSWGERREDGV